MSKLDKIVQRLIVNGTLTEQPGLLYGKMGIAIFFFHYARYTGNVLFEDYAMDLIVEIQKQMNTGKMHLRYDTGISGLGVGFEYILQHHFLEAEDGDIFDDFDARMYRAAMYEPHQNLSLQEGVTGWGRYFMYRLQGNGQKNAKLHEALTKIIKTIAQKIMENKVLENEQQDVYRFLHDLSALSGYEDTGEQLMQKCREWQWLQELDVQKLFPNLANLQRLYTCQNCFNVNLSEEIAQEWKKWEEMENCFSMNMGLLNGLAAECMLHLTFFDRQNISWIKLL